MEKYSSITKIYIGKDSLASAIGAAQRVFLVCDPFMVSSGMAGYVTNFCGERSIQYEVFSEVRPDPDIETVAAGMARIIGFKPDHVAAMGGGSAIDAAKAIVYFAHQQGVIASVPFTAIPTTSGTGSEVSTFAVITDHNKNVKYPMVDDCLLPTNAVLNAELVMSLPPRVTADTGMDVLTHAIEAYVSSRRTDFSDAMAEKAIGLVSGNLLAVYGAPGDYDARQHMHNGSCMAGIAFSNAGLGLNHAMAHTLGAKFHIPHGRANAILLPYVIAFNAGLRSPQGEHIPKTAEAKFAGAPAADAGFRSPSCEQNPSAAAERYAEIAALLGVASQSRRQSVLNLIKTIRSWNEKMDIPGTIHEAGVSEADFMGKLPEMCENAMADGCLTTNPRPCTKEELRQVFLNAFSGRR